MPAPITKTISLTSPGTYFLEDDGIVDNATSQLRRPDGSIVTVVHPTSLLKITASEPGVNLVINLADSLDYAKFTVGDLTNSALPPQNILVNQLYCYNTVSLVANGEISDPIVNEALADIYAPRLILSAGTGIGQQFFPLEYYGGVIEAETGTGGIRLKSFSDLVIGGLTDQVA